MTWTCARCHRPLRPPKTRLHQAPGTLPGIRSTGLCRACNNATPTATPALPGEWVDDALCAQTDADVWFPEDYRHHRGIRIAKEICGRCSVRDACLAFALTNDERGGIYGGLTVSERDELRGRSS